MRLVLEIRELSFEERLKELDLKSLENSKENGAMITTYKICTGVDEVNTPKM